MNRLWAFPATGVCLLLLSVPAPAQEVSRAIAAVHPTEGHDAWGIVEFTEAEEGIRVVATIHGLQPNQRHGIHVHEWGECNYPDAERAGGHFDPTGSPHGAPWHRERHVGDLGNIQADELGVGRYHRIDTELSFEGDRSILGRSVVIHEQEDDFRTQPTGDAGARIACGVIGIAKPREDETP
jgi:superoxide dismutase, Cu-Zn family